MKYFYEKTSDHDFKIGYKVKKNIVSKTIKGESVKVIENPFLGKLFIVNDLIQFIEKYEFVFSEIIAHSIMFSHPKVEKVLFISEFDRGIIKEILKHKTVNELFFISDKEKLQEVFEEHFFKREPSVKIVFDNAKEYIENFQNYFDIIIIDSKNPDFKDKDFLKLVAKSLTKEGMLGIVNGFSKEPTAIKNEFKSLKSLFKYSAFLKSSFNLQVFSNLGIKIYSKKVDVAGITERVLNSRFKHFEGAKKLKYYSPQIHLSSMVIPKFYNIK